MNDLTMRIAERYFKVSTRGDMKKDIPHELLDLPRKVEIIRAKEKVEIPKVEAPVVEAEAPKEEVKKVIRRKRNERAKVKKDG